jgi:hypothetical protein
MKQGSGSVGIWACMSYRGDVYFKIFDGRLNQCEYAEILKETLLPNMPKLAFRVGMLQYFNTTMHPVIAQNRFKHYSSKKKSMQWFGR